MAMVERKECESQMSQNADTCAHCGDVIKEPKPKFSLVDLIHKISVPVVLSVAGTMITILSYFSKPAYPWHGTSRASSEISAGILEV
jgi:hypothetical protein